MVCGLRSSQQAVPLRACSLGMGVFLEASGLGAGGDHPCAVAQPAPRPLRAQAPSWPAEHASCSTGGQRHRRAGPQFLWPRLSWGQGPAHPPGFQLLLRRPSSFCSTVCRSPGIGGKRPPSLLLARLVLDSGLPALRNQSSWGQGAPTSFQEWG